MADLTCTVCGMAYRLEDASAVAHRRRCANFRAAKRLLPGLLNPWQLARATAVDAVEARDHALSRALDRCDYDLSRVRLPAGDVSGIARVRVRSAWSG